MNTCSASYWELYHPEYFKTSRQKRVKLKKKEKKDGQIRKFYIVDFYIPAKSIIIETDGKFHDEQIKQDEKRTSDIKKHYPNIKIIRWRWHDFDSYIKVKDLLNKIR